MDLDGLRFLSQRVFAILTNEVLLAIPLFVSMGVLLERSRIAEDLLTEMGALFGRLPGGLGISVTLVGMLLAASTGIVGATVVTMALIALPAMLRGPATLAELGCGDGDRGRDARPNHSRHRPC